jgi:hypothetical protein
MLALQCVGIVQVMGLSHGDSTPKGTVPTHRRVVSRKALCISGDGVLCGCSGKYPVISKAGWCRFSARHNMMPVGGHHVKPGVARTPTACKAGLTNQPSTQNTIIAVPLASAMSLHGLLGRIHRCSCDSAPPLDRHRPEGLGDALHGAPSETGKPKVMGLYPPQVSGALISESSAKGNNAGSSLAGRCFA